MTLLVIFISIFYIQHARSQKINGVSFVASPDPIEASHILPIKNCHANWAAVMPFGFVRSLATPQLEFDTEHQWWGERAIGTKETIRLLHEQNIQVLLKPQLWVSGGSFTGDITMKSEADWQKFEIAYRAFILRYARIAQQQHVAALCIGTELSKFVFARSSYWSALIAEIRSLYSGKLTYAANWDTYDAMPFWCEMDYIGIDAYFPISPEKNPSLEAITMGWESHKKSIEVLQSIIEIPVLFTEYGYRSIDYSGKTPWETSRLSGAINHEIQQHLLQGLYDTFWSENWFAGGFLWKWFHDYENSGGLDNNRFTVQNKPAEATVKRQYRTK